MNDTGRLPPPELWEITPALDRASRPSPTIGKSRGKRWLIGFCVLLPLIAAIGFGVWRHYLQHRQVIAAATAYRDFVPTVRVNEVRANGDKMSVSLPGTTSAYETANLFARASGYIGKRYVDIGSRVKAGELMAEITAPELDHQIALQEANIAQTEAALGQATANRDLARVTSQRTTRLTQEGWVSKEQGDTDRLNYEAQGQMVHVAEANIAAQKAQLLVLRQQKAYQEVIAPFDGVVTQRNVDVGSLVQADDTGGTSMFTLAQSDVIRVQLFVPQDAAFGVAPGVGAVVHVPEIPDRTFPGTVTRIADALDPTTRTLLTEIDVPNPDGTLTPGIYCTVDLQIPRKTPSLLVPSDAIIFNRSGLQVAVVEDGIAHIRPITVARDLGTSVEVRDGVKDGDEVISNPPVDLVDGGKVQVQPEPVAANP
jgi:RND family efflux transporter MFP subunit